MADGQQAFERTLRFPGNCLLVAVCAWLLALTRTRLHRSRNKRGRWHVYFERDGQCFEFYTPGASRCSYLRNALRLGTIRHIGGGSNG